MVFVVLAPDALMHLMVTCSCLAFTTLKVMLLFLVVFTLQSCGHRHTVLSNVMTMMT